jgi:hypothetical protein
MINPMSLEPVPIGIQHDPGAVYQQGELVINSEARRKHMAIFGTTGAGKSTLMRNMIATDIASGIGCTVVDPHGQLVEDILNNHIPRSRIDDVIYFNPKDPARTIPLNLLDSPDHELDGVVVDNVISIFKQLWPDAFGVGARMEDIFRNSFYALIENPSPTSLWNLPPFLTNDAYRAVILRKVKNPAVRDFFENTYNKWTASYREEAISPVLNKCRPFLTDPRIRAVIGPAHSTFRFRTLMDDRKILLCDLSKGAIGQDNARLLGSLIAMQEKLAALSRYNVPEEQRVSHVLYVEEAHNFIGDFESILSETRKFNLHLVLATQAIDQLPRPAASAVFANCATLITFRVSSTDAQRLHDEFAMIFSIPEELQSLPDYKAYVRTLIENGDGAGRPTGPHLVSTYPPFPKTNRNADRENVILISTRGWTKSRSELEAKLARVLKRTSAGTQPMKRIRR